MIRILLLAMALVLASFPAATCSLAHDDPPQLAKLLATSSTTTDGYQAGPGLSGAWYDAARNGEGIILEMLPSGRALAIWFTYPAAGEPGEQAWLIAQDGIIEGVLMCLLGGGHALLEGVPGLGKTMLVRTMAETIHASFSRIQFTPDLMPADIVGTNVIVEDHAGKRFELQRGPIFANIVLADEINRATPKTQSALLVVMDRARDTDGGEAHAEGAPPTELLHPVFSACRSGHVAVAEGCAMERDSPVAATLIAAARQLSASVSTLTFSPPVSHVYNPLSYAWSAHELYLRRYGASTRRVVFLGMNPGPFGMVQCGVPFGEVAAVRDWLGIEAAVLKPAVENPRRPIEGFACARSEVSGRRPVGIVPRALRFCRRVFC